MGGPWEVIAHGPPDLCRRAVDAAYREIERIESLLSRFRPDSVIARMNQTTKPCEITVEPEVGRLIAEALRYAALTEGAFDPTAGALSRLWGFGPDGPRSAPPNTEEIEAVLGRVGYRHLHVDEDHLRVVIDRPGIELDLGAVGKGYAVDRAVDVLKLHGVERGWISCGSTGYALGAPMGRKGWRIGIRDPKHTERVIRTVPLRDRALSTSGTSEQFFVFDGKCYGHVCDPRTGGAAAGPACVTVIAPTATRADILSTAAYVMGVDEGLGFLQSESDVEACFADERNGDIEFVTTSGWDGAGRKGWSRRRFLAGLLAATGLLILKPASAAGTVYLTDDDALRLILPEGRDFVKETVTLTNEQTAAVGRLIEKKIEDNVYTFYRATGPDPAVTIGLAVVLNVIGKERPITFMVGVSPQAQVIGIEVLIYRESQGSEIRSKRFMKQFIGKTIEAPLKLGRDIDGISGASLSSRSTAYAVKKALAITQVVYGIHAESSP